MRTNNKNKNCKTGGSKPRNRKPDARNTAMERYEQPQTARETNDTTSQDGGNKYFNDPIYYYTNKDVTDSALRMNFEFFAGTPYSVGNTSVLRPLNILAYYMYPSPNRISPFGNDPVSAGSTWAARKLYTALSSITGRTSNYTSNTLTIMFLAMGELLSMYSYMRRAFTYLYTYNKRNWGLPQGLFQAMGIDFDDFSTNVANYRTEFNTIVNDMNTLAIISSVSYFAKCATMYDYIFADENADMAQLWMMVPASTWVLHEGTPGEATNPEFPSYFGSWLETRQVGLTNGGSAQVNTFSSLLTLLREMVNALMQSTTLQMVYSDVLNYCSKNGVTLMRIPLVGGADAEDIKTSETMNQQMHHAMLTGFQLDTVNSESQLTKGTTTPTYSVRLHRVGDVDATGYQLTAGNDVYEDVDADTILYYPMTLLITPTRSNDGLNQSAFDYGLLQTLLYDADYIDEDLNRRIENTRYMTYRSELFLTATDGSNAVYARCFGGDHSVAHMAIFVPTPTLSGINTNEPYNVLGLAWCCTDTNASATYALQALDLPPLIWGFTSTFNEDNTVETLTLAGLIGDLKNVTKLDPAMLLTANSLIERDLLDVRTLKTFQK